MRLVRTFFQNKPAPSGSSPRDLGHPSNVPTAMAARDDMDTRPISSRALQQTPDKLLTFPVTTAFCGVSIVFLKRGESVVQVPQNCFFFPSFASSDATAPLGILAVATPLERAGFEICLIDSTITSSYKKQETRPRRSARQRLSFMVPPFSIARAFNRGQAEFMLPEGQSSG